MTAGTLTMIAIAAILAVALICLLYEWMTDNSAQERRDRLKALAVNKGWMYTQQDPTLVDLSTGEPFGEGENPRVIDVLRGTVDGHDFVAFDYVYEVQRDAGDHWYTEIHNNMMVCVYTPRSCHWLRIGPEREFSGLRGALGMSDIQLESDDFNQRFRIIADTDRFAYDVLNPRTMERMLDEPQYFDEVRFEEGKVIAWYADELEEHRVEPTVRYLTDILALVPDFAWEQH